MREGTSGTYDKKDKLRKAIVQYMDDRKMSQNKFAESANLSKAHVSNIIGRKWQLVSDELVEKLSARFVIHKWGLYPTANFNAIQTMCSETQADASTLTLPLYSGAGKTTALRAYTESHRNAFYIYCSQLMTRKDFLLAIMDAVGFRYDSNILDMLQETAKKVGRMDTPLLVFDEADKLSDQCLLLLKVLYDLLEFNCAFVTAGTEVLVKRIDRSAKRDKLGYREIKRRLFSNVRVLNPFDTARVAVAQEIRAMCSDQGIGNESFIAYIMKDATNYGDVRNMIHAYHRRMARKAVA